MVPLAAQLEYLDRWVNDGEFDAYHSLLELGCECASLAALRLKSESTTSKRKRVIELLREMRCDAAMHALLSAVLDREQETWKAAVEALAYQRHGALERELDRLLEVTEVKADTKKHATVSQLRHGMK